MVCFLKTLVGGILIDQLLQVVCSNKYLRKPHSYSLLFCAPWLHSMQKKSLEKIRKDIQSYERNKLGTYDLYNERWEGRWRTVIVSPFWNLEIIQVRRLPQFDSR